MEMQMTVMERAGLMNGIIEKLNIGDIPFVGITNEELYKIYYTKEEDLQHLIYTNDHCRTQMFHLITKILFTVSINRMDSRFKFKDTDKVLSASYVQFMYEHRHEIMSGKLDRPPAHIERMIDNTLKLVSSKFNIQYTEDFKDTI